MRHWIVALMVGIAAAAAQAACFGAGPIKLSEGIDAVCETIAATPPSTPRVLLVDVPTLDPNSTRSLLDAINDLRNAKGMLLAVCTSKATPTREGAAIAALACDAMVIVKGGSLVGAETSWCKSASSRDRLSEDLARLGRIDPKLAARFVDSATELTWLDGVGFNPPDQSARKIAAAGKPLACNAAALTEFGIEVKEADSIDTALAMVSEGRVRPRKPLTSAKAPAKPAAPKSPPAGTDQKLSEKLAEYGTSLAELKVLLREFNDYFKGDKGIWKYKNPGLKWVWSDQSDNTDHADTRMACQRLQRDIKTKMSNLDSCLKSVERLVKDNAHPEVVRMTANKVALDGLRSAFERNKVSNYETFYPQVLALK